MTAPRSLDLVVAALLAPPAVLTAMLAVGGLVSGDTFAMGFGATMGLASAGMAWGAAQHVRSGLAGLREEEVDRLTRKDEYARGELGHTRCRWEFDEATWRRFWKQERADRRLEAIGIVLGFGAFGGLLLAWARGVDGCTAASFATLFGLMFAGFWLFWVTRGASSKHRVVELAGNTLHIGGMRHVFRSTRFTLEAARVLRDREPAALEFQVSWATRGGRASEEIRAPIPSDRLEEASEIVRELLA